jgi:hypothetical protein
MTVNHGVPGSSPGGGAKKESKIFSVLSLQSAGFFYGLLFWQNRFCKKHRGFNYALYRRDGYQKGNTEY